MKQIVLLTLSLFFAVQIYAQETALKITNQETGKETIIKEGKRIRIKNRFGQEFAGRFVAKEGEAIVIDGMTIQLNDIVEVKRNPVLLSAFTSGLLIYGGALLTGIGVMVGVFGNPAGFIMILPGAAMIYAGIKSKGFNKRYRAEDDWSYKLDTVSR